MDHGKMGLSIPSTHPLSLLFGGEGDEI